MKDRKTKVIKDEVFPFFDMALTWEGGKWFNLGFYRKLKQALKYKETSSMHRPTVFKFITSKFFIRIT
eukprot:5797474-Ditylum_brightwellii.AAC.1